MASYSEKSRIKSSKFLIWAGFFVYVMMMGSKNVFTAEIEAIMSAFSSTKAVASLAMTYYFITYAIAQVILSILYSRLNLKLYLSITLGLSGILTVILGVMPNINSIYVICAINGILQAGCYGGVMACISKYSPLSLLPYANRVMCAGSAVYGVIAYGVPALFVSSGKWNYPFFILGAIFIISAILFFIAMQNMKKYPPAILVEKGKIQTTDKKEKPLFNLSSKKKKFTFLAVMLFLSLIANLMYYLIMQWIPSMLNEEFNMPLSYSLLITLCVPIVTFICNLFAINICNKNSNPFTIGSILIGSSLAFLAPMLFVHDFNIILSIVCLILYITLSSAGRLVYTSILALNMRTQMNTGAYLSAINSIASVIAGVAPPIAGTIIDSIGYRSLFVILFAVGVLCLLIYLAIMIVVNKNAKKVLDK